MEMKTSISSVAGYRKHPYTVLLALCLAAFTLFRYFYILKGPNGISFDEAQYWQWSRHLDLSYYAKGPVIAYLIAFSTWLMGDTELGIRFFAPILLALTSIYMYRLALLMFSDERTACASGLIIQIIPLFHAQGIVMTIDPPFIFFWTLSLYLFWKAACDGHHRSLIPGGGDCGETLDAPRTAYWLLLGLGIGLGLLTKYIMALFYMCAFLFLLTSKQRRHWLIRKEPYLAFLLSVAVFSPVIIWNMNHDWVSLKHTAGHAHVVDGLRISLKDFIEFIGSQIGVITPLVFFAMIKGAVKNRALRSASEAADFLFWFWVPVLGFFLIKSLQGKVQANWAITAYITACIASADFFLNRVVMKKWEKIYLVLALCMAFSVTAIAHSPAIIDLPVKFDTTARLRGWKELGLKAGEVYQSMTSSTGRQVFVFSDTYVVSSELAFYMPGKPETYLAKLGSRRMNQYDIWGGFDKLLGYDALFVTTKEKYKDFPDRLRNAFDAFEQEKFTVMERGRVLRDYYIFRCYGFKGFDAAEFNKY